MRYDSRFDGRLVNVNDGRSPSPAEAEAFMDDVAAELEKLYAEDIDVSTNLETCEVSITISTEAEDALYAGFQGNATIRTAIHAAGGHTPGWSIDWTTTTTSKHEDLVDV